MIFVFMYWNLERISSLQPCLVFTVNNIQWPQIWLDKCSQQVKIMCCIWHIVWCEWRSPWNDIIIFLSQMYWLRILNSRFWSKNMVGMFLGTNVSSDIIIGMVMDGSSDGTLPMRWEILLRMNKTFNYPLSSGVWREKNKKRIPRMWHKWISV